MKWDLKRTARYYFIRLKRLQGSPFSLAMGTALGAGIAATPTLPLHTIIIVCLTLALRVNTIAALIAATLISNPFTFVPQYYLAWKIGDFFLPGRLNWCRIKNILDLLQQQGLTESLHTLSHLGMDAILVMLTGGLVLGLPIGIIAYIFSYRFFLTIQIKRLKKHRLD